MHRGVSGATSLLTGRGASAYEVFRRLGLVSTGFWRSVAIPPTDEAVAWGARLREAFETLGGLYIAFARFLLWRADLLAAEHLNALREIRYEFPPVPRDAVIELLRKELGGTAESLVSQMEAEPLWSGLSRTAYLSWRQGKPVVVQIGRETVSEAALLEFESGIRFLGHPDVCRVTAPGILDQFRQWLRHGESTSLERSYLEVLGRSRGATFVDYPELIPEISTSSVLCWPWVDGEPVSALARRGSIEDMVRVAVAVLEQFCNLGIVDSDLQLESMILPAGSDRLAIRRLGRPLSVPPPAVNNGMKYIAAVLEGNASISVQNLLTMAVGQSTPDLESELLNLMSGIEPELKVHAWYPGSASAIESNWRALAKLEVSRPRPLYLDCLHRNLIAIGYWSSDAVSAGGKAIDAISEAQWPVVERVVRSNATEFFKPAALAEWSVGLGLLTFGAIREANRLAEELRDNNLTLEVESVADSRLTERRQRPRLGLAVVAGIFLMAVLFALRWGSTMRGPAAILMFAVAVGALAGLFRAIAKIR